MVMWREIGISLITCNSTPFYPIEVRFSPEIIEFYAELLSIFLLFFPNSFLIPNLDIIYDVTIAATWDKINTNK